MVKKEVIILAGGLGSRLNTLSLGLPKCMMQIGKHPFLYHLLWQFLDLGAERIILATANKSEYIHKFVNEKFKAQVLAGKILFSNE